MKTGMEEERGGSRTREPLQGQL